MVIHRPPVLNFPLKKITWSGLYRYLTRKSHKLPDTIRQEVVKSLLNYTALPERVGQNALRLQMPSHRGERTYEKRGQDST